MNQIIAQLTETINSFLNDTFTSLSTGSIEWETEISDRLENFVPELIATKIQMLDDAFFNSQERMKLYLSKDRVTRTLTTTLGTITFKRYKYKRRDGKGWYYYIDDLLNIDKYERISKDVKAQLLKLISADQLSYQKAADRFSLSKTVVYYLLRSLDLENAVVSLDKKIECEYLHVMADEDHISLQEHRQVRKSKDCPKTNSHIVKHVTLFTDVKKVSKHRNSLVDRVILTPVPGESSDAFYERINHFIFNNYNIKYDTYAYGDGANWIKAMAQEINAPFILDKFHMQQALVKVSSGDKEALQELQKLLEHNKKKEFFTLLDSINEGKDLSQYKRDQISYINNQWANYQRNFTIPKSKYCCAEGINSHYFSSRLSSRPRGFSKTNVHNLAFLLSQFASHHQFTNGIKSLLTQPQKRKSNRINTSKYYAPVTLPVLQFGQTSWQYKSLKAITKSRI